MSIFKNKKNDLYLSDKQPLTVGGKIALAISYIFLILWAVIIIVPISQIVISSFNGAQSSRLIIGGEFKFSFKHFEILFKETDYLKELETYIQKEQALIIRDDDTVIGAMMFNKQASSIDFLAVHPQYRKC